MASPSAWGTSWKTKTTVNESAAFTVSCSCYTSSSSIFYISLTKRNQTHVTKFSLDQTPNPQISKDDKIVFKNKPIHSTVEPEAAASSSSSSLLKDENFMNSGQVIGKKRGNGILVNRMGSRPLWRRIFFASKKVRSIILINVITLVYASNIPVIKEVEAIIDPAVFTVVRFTMSAIPFIPFIIKARGDTQLRAAGLELGVWVSLGYLMQALGLLTSDAGRASFLSLFTVILVPLLDGMLGATVPAYTWFGALISLLGVGMLESSGSPPCLGDLWNFLSAVFFGIHMLRTEHISRNTKKSNFLALLGYEVCVISLFSIMWFSIGGGFSSESGWDPEAWTWTSVSDWIVRFPWIPALYTGIFSTGVCLWVEMAAMRDVSATETAIIYGLEPLWGAGFAWFLLGERWGLIGWIGAALVLGGSLTVQIFGSLPPTKSSDERSSGRVEPFLVSSKPNALSASPIVVSSRKDVQDRVKKK